MKKNLFTLLVWGLLTQTTSAQQPSAWLTTLDKTSLLKPLSDIRFTADGKPDTSLVQIQISKDSAYQLIDGFGFALTGGSAQHMINMSASARKELIQELFSRSGNGIGISYLRLSIGASDLNDHVFSYNDLAPGETDISLAKFNLNQDTVDVIPVLKEILAINPSIKILGSPWSAPAWMKTNNNIQGGRLKEIYYPVYALYFLKYIKAMKNQGIAIDAITIQNEPFNNGNTPSMQMFAKEQARFIRDHLGPLLRTNKLKTKIILYDHNCDAPEYPISILTDKTANSYIDGSGFHLYAGPISAMSKVHNAFPGKHLYFTEMMAVNRKEFNIAGPVDRIVIGATRNWSRNVILWNLAANSANKPHTDNGGCSMCQGAVSIDGDSITRNLAYYTIAHVAKFVVPGSVRIKTNATEGISNVAFRTPAGSLVLLVANKTEQTRGFQVSDGNRSLTYTLPAGSVVTFEWK